MKTLNAYKIIWAIEVKSNGQIVKKHFVDLNALKKDLKHSLDSTVYIISDKQFGMIQMSFNGIEKPLPKPFNYKLIEKEGDVVAVIPLTERQFNNPFYGN